MKKDRLTITISDVNTSKSYSVNKVIKKILLWILVIIVLVFSISFFTISELINSVNKLSQDSKALEIQNIMYSDKIKLKIKQIKELGSELEKIEDIIGINIDDTTTLIQRATLAKLTSAQKSYMLQTIPNNCPLEKCTTTSKFRWRTNPITKQKQYHKGIDLRAARRTTVHSTADGVVRYMQDKNIGTLKTQV